MDLELDPDQIELRDHARSFLASACPPALVRSVFEGADAGGAATLWSSMVDLGWPGLAADPAHGGLGQGFVAEGVLAAELGRVVAPVPYLATVTQFAPLLAAAGADDLLVQVTAGSTTGAVAFGAASVTARPDGGAWLLDGAVSHVLEAASADRLTVIADGGAFLVPTGSVSVEPSTVVDPTMPLATVRLDGVSIGSDAVLLDPTDPASATAIERVRLQATVAMTLSGVATCRAIFEATVEYAKLRHQFGRAIGSFQAIKHRLADFYLAVERADALAWYAAACLAEDDARLPVAAAMAKAALGDCQRLATKDGLQLHGGIGFTWEHDLHFLLKRAITTAFLFGNAEHHRAELTRLLGLVA